MISDLKKIQKNKFLKTHETKCIKYIFKAIIRYKSINYYMYLTQIPCIYVIYIMV